MSSTSVSAQIIDNTNQVWANGTYSITFAPNPNLPSGNYQWNGAPFVPQVYTGSMDGGGNLNVTLPDNSTITPAGSAWTFVLCPNASAVCTTVTIPVTGADLNLSTFFSSIVIPPQVTAATVPRAYTSAEVPAPPLLSGGMFFGTTANVPFFWTGTQWISLGGSVVSVGLEMPPEFTVTGSPITEAGTFDVVKNSQPGLSVYCNQLSTPAQPSFQALTEQMVAQAGTLVNNTTGNASSASFATLAGGVSGGYVASVTAGTGISVSPTTGNAVVTNTGVTEIIAGSNVTISPSGGTGHVTVNATVPNIQFAQNTTGCSISGGSSFNTATMSVTWPVPFADNAYAVSVVGINPFDTGNGTSGRLVCNGVIVKSASGITVQFSTTGTSSGSMGYSGMDCIAIHS